MKLAEIKQLTTAELQERLVAQQKEYEQKCINHAVSPLDKPSDIRQMRRDIARMKTILSERELSNN